ncbi:unnamed protein product [Lymnaea stagnalis]|uniref:UBC core domain-containing protein n=1 Tax=Lymnaea stagnalis TaxID=6523 RepID=A0AAV2I2K2_LYMST
MYSRAHLIIEREHKKLVEDPPWGIEAWPLYEDSIFEWMAKIKGLKNTDWEGGIFKIYIRFDEHFNIRPPQVFFQTIPFHPNVDVTTGRPCVDFLDDNQHWKESYSFSMVLITLQALISNPVLKNAVNTEAAQMLHNSPQSYLQMVKECVKASQLVDAGGELSGDEAQNRQEMSNIPPQSTFPQNNSNKRRTRLSFEDYHSTWCAIGTSKPKQDTTNSYLDTIKDQDRLQEIHLGLPRKEVEEHLKKQMEDHNTMMYGVFKNKPSLDTIKAAKLAKLEKMKQIYLPPQRTTAVTQEQRITEVPPPSRNHLGENDVWENEVDELVKWTNSLNSNSIDAT